jgi:hypothetical protein
MAPFPNFPQRGIPLISGLVYCISCLFSSANSDPRKRTKSNLLGLGLHSPSRELDLDLGWTWTSKSNFLSDFGLDLDFEVQLGLNLDLDLDFEAQLGLDLNLDLYFGAWTSVWTLAWTLVWTSARDDRREPPPPPPPPPQPAKHRRLNRPTAQPLFGDGQHSLTLSEQIALETTVLDCAARRTAVVW